MLTTKPVDGNCAFRKGVVECLLYWYSMQARLLLGITRPGNLCMQGGSERSSLTSGGICIGRAEQTIQSEEIHFPGQLLHTLTSESDLKASKKDMDPLKRPH